MGRPAVFLDRDGTLIREAEYLHSPEQVRLLPRAAEAVRRLNHAGFAVVLATNQSGIARGLLTERDVDAIHTLLRDRLAKRAARLDAVYFCPHHPSEGLPSYRRRCSCRKPAPGMMLQAARELDLDLTRCFAVGDSQRDLAAGRKAGCRTVLVRTGYGRETELEQPDRLAADHVADDLAAAVDWILSQDRDGRRR